MLILPGNAIPSDVLNGDTFSAGINYIVNGTIPVVAGGNTVMPSTVSQQIIAANNYVANAINVAGDPNLIASSILSGQAIFGVTGNVIAGKLYASGSVTSSATTTSFTGGAGQPAVQYYSVTVSGLNFPNGIDTIVLMMVTPDVNTHLTTYTSHPYIGNGGPNSHVMIDANGVDTGSNAAYVNTTGFCMPFNAVSAALNWYAWGL